MPSKKTRHNQHLNDTIVEELGKMFANNQNRSGSNLFVAIYKHSLYTIRKVEKRQAQENANQNARVCVNPQIRLDVIVDEDRPI